MLRLSSSDFDPEPEVTAARLPRDRWPEFDVDQKRVLAARDTSRNQIQPRTGAMTWNTLLLGASFVWLLLLAIGMIYVLFA